MIGGGRGGAVEVSIGGGETEAGARAAEVKSSGADPNGTFWKSFFAMFGVQYTYTVPAVVLLLLKYEYGSVDGWVTSSIDGVVFFGTIVGMVTIGYMGDKVGRSRSYLWTLVLAISSSTVCTFGAFGGKEPIEIVLVVLRLFIGLACGGFFPLSAAESFEEAGSIATVKVVSSMTVGQLLPYLIAAACAMWQGIQHSDSKLSWVFHGLLFVGILPFLFALPHAIRHTEAEAAGSAETPAAGAGLATIGDMAKVVAMPQYRWKLLACGTCWFCYDAVGFWIGLYSPTILDEIFTSEDLLNNMLQNIYACSTCCVAAVLSVLVLQYRLLSTSMFLVVGCFFMATCFAVTGYIWSDENTANGSIFVAFLLCRFSTWIAVPHCVYLIPNQIFPREIRSTCNGITAAIGKLGAVFGVFVIPNVGLDAAGRFGLCAGLCGLNMVIAAGVLIPTQVMSDVMSAEGQPGATTPLLSDPI